MKQCYHPEVEHFPLNSSLPQLDLRQAAEFLSTLVYIHYLQLEEKKKKTQLQTNGDGKFSSPEDSK